MSDTADVVVIGGGVIGTSIAFAVARILQWTSMTRILRRESAAYLIAVSLGVTTGIVSAVDPEHSFRLHRRYIPAKGGMGRNSIAYENPEVDRLLDAGVRDVDREKRKKAYFRLQELLADELPYLPIFHYVNIRGTRKGVQGFEPNANMQEYTWNPNEWWIRR